MRLITRTPRHVPTIIPKKTLAIMTQNIISPHPAAIVNPRLNTILHQAPPGAQ
jgi:hypothetical protein